MVLAPIVCRCASLGRTSRRTSDTRNRFFLPTLAAITAASDQSRNQPVRIVRRIGVSAGGFTLSLRSWPGASRTMTYNEFDKFCRALPASTYVVQWGGSHVWKVGGKV